MMRFRSRLHVGVVINGGGLRVWCRACGRAFRRNGLWILNGGLCSNRRLCALLSGRSRLGYIPRCHVGRLRRDVHWRRNVIALRSGGLLRRCTLEASLVDVGPGLVPAEGRIHDSDVGDILGDILMRRRGWRRCSFKISGADSQGRQGANDRGCRDPLIAGLQRCILGRCVRWRCEISHGYRNPLSVVIAKSQPKYKRGLALWSSFLDAPLTSMQFFLEPIVRR